jgi:D-aminopeptidase
MLGQKRARDYGIKIGSLEPGKRNSITDIKGVKVGHVTLNENDMTTGVTAILPHSSNLFKSKVLASSYVINGFGKSTGLVQVDEMGTIETPILLTNTHNVGICTDALITYMQQHNEEIGRTTGSVNPVVCECNDMVLNDIRARYVKSEHVIDAIERASSNFLEGSVGAGTGMKCFSLKGGIGTSSRLLHYEHGTYHIGSLILSNFGRLRDLRLDGEAIGQGILSKLNKAMEDDEDKGSIIMIIGTDLPVTERQLKRMIKRAGVGLARTGSYFGNGSGDIVLGFSTASLIPHQNEHKLRSYQAIHEADIEQAFRGVVETVEEAIINSMVTADRTKGRDGKELRSLKEFISI